MSWHSTNKATSLGDHLKTMFKPENMDTGMKRGMVLKIYRAKVKEVAGETLAKLCTGAKLKGNNTAPNLVIYTSHQPARHELNYNAHAIKKAINERLKCEFIQKVYIK